MLNRIQLISFLFGFYHVISTKVLYPKTLNFLYSAATLSLFLLSFPTGDRSWNSGDLRPLCSPTSTSSRSPLLPSLSLLNYGRPPPIGGNIRQVAATPPQAVALWWLTWRRQQWQRSVVDAIKAATAWTPVPRVVTNQNSDNLHTLLILLIFLVVCAGNWILSLQFYHYKMVTIHVCNCNYFFSGNS
ncbi:hypothetical protein Hdeb2414_s0019g00544671 [Helianthus debilis subsp. tardiflorus]